MAIFRGLATFLSVVYAVCVVEVHLRRCRLRHIQVEQLQWQQQNA